MSEEQVVDRVRIGAPAKVNLILRVLDRRPDGYHNIWSLMQTIALEDELHLRLRRDSTAVQLTTNDASLPTDERNLIVRAASLLLERSGVSVGLDIELSKRIPVGAGLGGGSSDAAATIVGLNHLLRLGWSKDKMATVGQTLGSDVPFFFMAPSAIVRGRGQELNAVRLIGERWVVLIQPGFPIETTWAYERLASTRPRAQPLSEALHRVSTKEELPWEEVIPLMENDFEQALASTHGVLSEIKRHLLSQGAEAALLSGSGSTVFGLFRTEPEAVRARSSFAGADGRWVAVARTSTHSLTCDQQASPLPLSVC